MKDCHKDIADSFKTRDVRNILFSVIFMKSQKRGTIKGLELLR